MQLVIAEKPSVAKSIAEVLGANERKDGYLEGNGYLVSWCVGHLIELAKPEAYGEQWKKWTYESLPVKPEEWQYEIKEDTKEQYEILERLMYEPKVDTIVCATDAGREGELIFRLVCETACCKKPVKRLWISSMEESTIREGFENLRPGEEYDNLYHSARCRQEADWLVGINGTRLFTVLYGGKTLKVGRVQTPTLAMLVERESKIKDFKKETYFMAHIQRQMIRQGQRLVLTCMGVNLMPFMQGTMKIYSALILPIAVRLCRATVLWMICRFCVMSLWTR